MWIYAILLRTKITLWMKYVLHLTRAGYIQPGGRGKKEIWLIQGMRFLSVLSI